MAEKKIEDMQGSTNSNLHQIKTLQKSLNETGTASCQLDNSDDELMPLSQSTPIPETSEGNPFSVTVTPSSSTKRFTIPKCVKDVSDLELRKKLEATEHQVKYVRHRERLSYCQLVYIYYWLDKNNENVSGRSEQTLRLIRNGERDVMWTKSWKPPGSRLNLHNYLQETLKNMAKRERLNDYKESLIVGDKNKSAATTDSL